MSAPAGRAAHEPPGRFRVLALLSLAELFGMSLWFSASAVAPLLKAEWGLSDASATWLTLSVQLGFVAGTLASAARAKNRRPAAPARANFPLNIITPLPLIPAFPGKRP